MEYDNYDPREENDFDDNKEGLDDFKKLDKGYYKLYKKMIDPMRRRVKRSAIELYASGQTGSNIRNAVTGEYTKYVVGKTQDEGAFFKVSIATGEISKINRMFFYNSPSEYERQFNTILSQNIKNEWEKRHSADV
jgi:hypothetical protein